MKNVVYVITVTDTDLTEDILRMAESMEPVA